MTPTTRPITGYVAVIPARRGSAGVKHKNLVELGGRPLIIHTVEAALESQRFQSVLVTSDDPTILRAVEGDGVTTIRRPDHLATDEARVETAVRHALDEFLLGGLQKNASHLVLLQPTSPLRRAAHIREAIHRFESSGANSLISICAVDPGASKFVRIVDGFVEPLADWLDLGTPRQLLPPLYRPNGAIFITGIEAFVTSGLLYDSPVGFIEMTPEDSIDVDIPDDLNRVRRTLEEPD